MDDGIYRVTDHDGSIELEWLRAFDAEGLVLDEVKARSIAETTRADRAERKLTEANARANRAEQRYEEIVRTRVGSSDDAALQEANARADRAEQGYQERDARMTANEALNARTEQWGELRTRLAELGGLPQGSRVSQAALKMINKLVAESTRDADRLDEANARSQREFLRGRRAASDELDDVTRQRDDLLTVRDSHVETIGRRNQEIARLRDRVGEVLPSLRKVRTLLVEAAVVIEPFTGASTPTGDPVVDRLVRAGKNSIRDLLSPDPAPWD